MNMKKYYIFLLIVTQIVFVNGTNFSQFSVSEDNTSSFYFDAICFRNPDKMNDSIDGRIDIFMLVPYQILSFEKNNDIFGAKFEVIFEVYDSTNSLVKSEKISKIIKEKDYFVTQGGNAGFKNITTHFFLNDGNYEVQTILKDLLSGNIYRKSRTITVIDFDKYRFALSGIMLISSIEERNEKYIITPHVSDNIGNLENGFFIFFEAYNNSNYDTVAFAYVLYDPNDKEIKRSKKIIKSLDNITQQFYNKVDFPGNAEPGIYKIRLFALKHTGREDFTEDDYLAITERSLKNYKTISGYFMQDIDQAIKYLRYVANQSDIEYIEAGSDNAEKQKRFEEFWKTLDPSPSTERNEAFDEYYSRIDYANKNFKSYNEGWLTDMGRVYIIFGPPDYIDESNSYNGRTIYVKWTYLNNREFIFADETGLGDFRLTSSFGITEKYRYNR
jgi:GWxTD domain-containing protein